MLPLRYILAAATLLVPVPPFGGSFEFRWYRGKFEIQVLLVYGGRRECHREASGRQLPALSSCGGHLHACRLDGRRRRLAGDIMDTLLHEIATGDVTARAITVCLDGEQKLRGHD